MKMTEDKNNNVCKFRQKSVHFNSDDKSRTKRTDAGSCGITVIRKYAYVVIPTCVALLSYANGLHGDLVHDDVFAIRNNPDVVGGNAVSQMFVNDFWGKPMASNNSHKSYRPLTILTFRLNYMLTGLQPFSFHLTNVLLHMLVTSLFAVTCRRVFQMSTKLCTMAALLFVVHPVHTEAVTGLVGRADVMAALFFLLAILAYHRSTQGRSGDATQIAGNKTYFTLSLVLAVAAMLSKETGVTALGVCLLLDGAVVYKQIASRQLSQPSTLTARHFLCRCGAVLLFTTILLWARAWIMAYTLPKFIYHDNPASFQSSFLTRILSYGYIWSQNAWVLLSPSRLCYDWQNFSIPLVTCVRDPRNLATLTTALLIGAAGVKVLRNCVLPSNGSRSVDPLFASLVLTIVPFLPATNIFFRVGFVLAERVLYIPSMGYCLLVASGLERIYRRFPAKNTFITTLFYLLLMLNGWKTWQQNQVWTSREALFRSGVDVMPHNTKVHYNYANYLKDIGHTDDAINHYRQTLRLDESYASAYNNLGTLLADRTEAERHFRKTMELVPQHQGAHINLGNALCKRGEVTEGLTYLHKVVAKDENSADGLASLASCLIESGNFTSANEYIQRAIRIKPDMQEAHVVMGKLQEKLGHHKESAASFRRAHDLDPSRDMPLVQAAFNYHQLGDLEQAERLLKEVLSTRRDVTALEQLALLYRQSGRITDSLHVYEEVSRLAPNTTEARFRYGKILANSGDYQRSLAVLQDLVADHPDSPDILYVTGQVLATTGRHNMAVEHFNRSIAILNVSQTSDVDVIDVIYDRANSYRDQNQYDMALKDYLTVLSHRPEHATCHGNVGTIYHIQGHLQKARHHYEETLRLDPDKSIIEENLKKLHRIMGSKTSSNG